jgi:hypothetical protein
MITVSVIKSGARCWRIAFNGQPRGDDRGYEESAAKVEARLLVAREKGKARAEGREPRYQLADELKPKGMR